MAYRNRNQKKLKKNLKKFDSLCFLHIFAPANGSVAQLNRAFDYGSKGYRFESCRSHKQIKHLQSRKCFFYFIPHISDCVFTHHKTAIPSTKAHKPSQYIRFSYGRMNLICGKYFTLFPLYARTALTIIITI